MAKKTALHPTATKFLLKHPKIKRWLATLTDDQQELILKVLSLGQGPYIFAGFDPQKSAGLDSFLRLLREMERFYDTIGGIAGYHNTVLHLIDEKKKKGKIPAQTRYLKPEWIDITKKNRAVNKAIRNGLEHLPKLAEIYPVGGAGDRLALICNIEMEPLPAAQLQFTGRTLLEGLIRDLQAREYLYYKLYGKQVTVPIALMTSHEKRNHMRITQALEYHKNFGRHKDSIRLFTQSLVPLITDSGHWAVKKALHPRLKPGGHGVVWKLAIDNHIFDWFEEEGKTKGLIRQINNPVAGTDYGLLAFTGVGFAGDKAFGFASCPRLPNTAEGTDLIIEHKTKKGYDYTLSNIEYTDFKEKGIEDKPASSKTPYSAYPSNTNILFFDFQAIRKATAQCPIPGMIINMKNRVISLDADGEEVECFAGRLESTMQNISDAIIHHSPKVLNAQALKKLPVFLTYNMRRKTISVAKNTFSPEKSIVGTPENCLYEMMENMHDLLSDYCEMKIPKLCDKKTYLEEGPNLFVLIHPSLGPLYSIIAQKIRGGKMGQNSDMNLEIAELDMENLTLNGSLIIKADHIMGHEDKRGVLHYGHSCGRCVLRDVVIKNKGIDRTVENQFWKNHVIRQEALEIRLQGNAEFVAEDVTITGNHHLVVPDGHRMIAYEEDGELHFSMEPLGKSWNWHYSYDDNDEIILSKN